MLQNWNGDQKGGEDQVDQKQHGGECLRMNDEQLGGGLYAGVTVRALAADRGGWKENIKVLCALWHREK